MHDPRDSPFHRPARPGPTTGYSRPGGPPPPTPAAPGRPAGSPRGADHRCQPPGCSCRGSQAERSRARPSSLPLSRRAVLPPAAPSHHFPLPEPGATARAGLGSGAPGGLGGPGCLSGGCCGEDRDFPWAAPLQCRGSPWGVCSRGGGRSRGGGGVRRRRWGSGWRGPGGPCRQRLPRQPSGLRLGRPLREGSGAVRREGGAAEPARAEPAPPGVGLVAGFVSAEPAVAVGGRCRPLGGGGWMWPGLGALFLSAVWLQGEKGCFFCVC